VNSSERGKLIAEGQWLYDASVPSRVVIVRREVWYGTGDHQDPPEIADDQAIETFELIYGSPGEPHQLNTGGGQYRTLGEAKSAAEAHCGSSLRWSVGLVP